jgi:hypothetical protein
MDRAVVLAVDSSATAVGFILFQYGDDSKRYPSRFGLIRMNEREARYSQAKLELYGLFRALQAYKMYLIGVRNLNVEVDAKYIKGMLNNPDVHPNTAVNRWIAAILLFDFNLVHIPGIRHMGANGLSRWPPAEGDDPEEWIDQAYRFAIELLNWSRFDTAKGRLTIASPYLRLLTSIFEINDSQICLKIGLDEEENSEDKGGEEIEVLPLIDRKADRREAKDRDLAQVKEFLSSLDKPQGMDSATTDWLARMVL